MSSEQFLKDVNGMPVMDDGDKAKGTAQGRKMMVGLFVVPKLIAFGIAYCIFHFCDHETYQLQINTLKQHDGGFAFLGVVLFSWLVWFLNMYPAMVWKTQIMGQHGNLRVNQFFYQVKPDLPFVMLVDDGDVGKYNRANRSLQHFGENSLHMVLNFVFASYVFPKPSFILMVVFVIGRIMHMRGYTNGYGSHAAGFMLSSMIGNGVLEMLVLLTAVSSFELI